MRFKVTKYYLSRRNNRHSRRRANGFRWWGYPSRRNRVTVIVVHTTENSVGTPARQVGQWQATTAPTPSSYHAMIDASTILRTVKDGHTAFHTVGLNSRSLGISFVHQAHRWGSSPAAEAEMLARAAQQCREWVEKYSIPVRWITLAQANRGVKGFIRHSTADPSRRRDPGPDFPADQFFALIRNDGRNYVTVGDDDPRAREWKQLASKLLPDSRNAFTSPDGRFGPQTTRLTLEAFKVLGLTASDPTEPKVGPASMKAIRDELARRGDGDFRGKRLVATAPRVNFYDSPRWTRPTGNFRRGQGFPVVEGITTRGGDQWYRVRNSAGRGPFYITTRDDLVQLR